MNINHQESSHTQKALRFLRGQQTAVLATVSPENIPHAAVISYLVDPNFNFFFMTRRGSRKCQNLEYHSIVSIAVGHDLARPVTVQALGRAEELAGDGRKEFDALAASADKKNYKWLPVISIPGGAFTVYKIIPFWLRLLSVPRGAETVPYAEPYEERFQQIIP